MLAQIIELLNANLERVNNLTNLYGPAKPGRRSVHDTDILRAALVLLHASMEDFLRSLLTWRAPLGSKELIDTYPLAGANKKHTDRFLLGSLVAHKGKTVDDLIKESVCEYLEKYASFNDLGEVKKALVACGIAPENVNDHDFGGLPAMIERRHKIVHKADRNDVQVGQGNHRTNSIGTGALNNYVAAVGLLRDFVEANL